ncbi:unnamed protein product, partial [Phaeothamnion confervicola]
VAWGFLRPLGTNGRCHVDCSRIRSMEEGEATGVAEKTAAVAGDGSARGPPFEGASHESGGVRVQLYRVQQPLSLVARWQARVRGLVHPPPLPVPATTVPAAYLQFLLRRRERMPCGLTVQVFPAARPRAECGEGDRASHDRRAGAALHHWRMGKIILGNAFGTAAGAGSTAANGAKPAGGGGSGARGGGRGSATASAVAAAAVAAAAAAAVAAARSRREREPTELCILPHRLLHRIYAGPNGASAAAFSRSGHALALACCDDPLPGIHPLRVVDPDTGRGRAELGGHRGRVHHISWSADDSLLLSASADGTAKVWAPGRGAASAAAAAAGTGSTSRLPGGSDGAAQALGAASSTAALAAAASASALTLSPPSFVYAAIFQPVAPVVVPSSSTVSLSRAFQGGPSANGAPECAALVITASFDRRLRLWSLERGVRRGRALGVLGGGATAADGTGHGGYVNALAYDERTGRLYSGDAAGTVLVWRRAAPAAAGPAGAATAEASAAAAGASVSVAVSTTAADYSVLRRIVHPDLAGRAVTSLALMPRRRRPQLLVRCSGGLLRLFDLGLYQPVNPGYAGAVGAFAGTAAGPPLARAGFSADGQWVVAGGEDGRMHLWDAQTGRRAAAGLAAGIAVTAVGLGRAICAAEWHPRQHVVALVVCGADAPVLLYGADRPTAGDAAGPSLVPEGGGNDDRGDCDEAARREANRRRLRELRVQRFR